MKIESLLVIVLWMAAIATLASAQSTEDLNVWNVYCSGDGSRCTVAKEPSGDLMFTVFPTKVDWNTVQTWMQANGYPAQPAVWNVYCNGDSSQCTVSKEPTGELMFPQFTGKVTWDTATNWLASWRDNNKPKVWNVYCNGDGSQCTLSKEPTGALMFSQFPGKVDWDTAQEWMASWRGEKTTGQSTPIGTGTGTAHTYNSIEFQVEGVALKANAEQTNDSIDLEGKNARAVHVLEFAGWSIGVPDNVKVGHINVWYEDESHDVIDLIMGVNIAEWAYDRSEIQSQLKHSKVAAAYSWPSTASSAYEYQGHYFYARVDTDPSKPLDRLELVLDPNEQKVQIEIRAITLGA
jgi:predicted transglutaminase-like cysteine proteinase